MRLHSAKLSVTVHKREYEFRDIDALLANDELPDEVRNLSAYVYFGLEDVPHGMTERVTVSMGPKPTVRVSARSELWAYGKLGQLRRAARALRPWYWWLRPWDSANLLIVSAWLLIVALVVASSALMRSGLSVLAVLGLFVGILLLLTAGVLDALVFRITHSRISRRAAGAWTRSDVIGLLSLGVAILSALLTVAFALTLPRS
jgi:hypothetical protein